MDDLKEEIAKASREFEKIKSYFDLADKTQELKKLEGETTDPEFWKDQEKAKSVTKKLTDLKQEIDEISLCESELKFLLGLSKTEDLNSVKDDIARIVQKINSLKLKSFLSDPYDKKDAILAIHAGQGGTEAMDWANMLYRMYLRYIDIRGWKSEIFEYSPGEEAGIKSVTLLVRGKLVYGYLKGESGTHRLVRQSPFNADKLRHTSFALVGVLPEIEEVDLPDVVIKDEDLDWQFFRSSTQGGQNVQKVSTAVRVKHIPTGLVATSQTERFQEQNRKIALDHLRAKLWMLEKEKREQNVSQIKGEYKPASWGNQIRSYVLHPYKMVKDLRTGIQTSDTEGVLNGEIDSFIEAELKLD